MTFAESLLHDGCGVGLRRVERCVAVQVPELVLLAWLVLAAANEPILYPAAEKDAAHADVVMRELEPPEAMSVLLPCLIVQGLDQLQV